MNDDLINKIKSEIIKSGFPLEVFCKRRLLANGWSCEGPTYVALADKIQEIDVLGRRTNSFARNLTAFFHIHVACKKSSSNHWIFFKEEHWLPAALQVHAQLIDRLQFNAKPLERPPRFRSQDSIRSRMHSMAFRAQRDQIYDAIQELLSSHSFFSEFYGRHRRERRPEFNILDVDFLTVLFDGKIFLADFDEREELTISEVSHVTYYHHEVTWPRHKHFTIDFVAKPFFDAYLKILASDVEYIIEAVNGQLVPEVAPNTEPQADGAA